MYFATLPFSVMLWENWYRCAAASAEAVERGNKKEQMFRLLSILFYLFVLYFLVVFSDLL